MKINRKKSISELIDELGYKKYINEDALKTIKNKGEKEVEVGFFTLNKYVSNSKLLKEYKTRNLIPDVGAVFTYLIKNPKTLDDKKHIGVQIEDNVYAIVSHWGVERGVYVDRVGDDWSDNWWFGGVRKVGTQPLKSSELLELESLVLRVEKLEEKLQKIGELLTVRNI